MSFTFNPTQTPKQIFIGLINYTNPDLETPVTEEMVSKIELVKREVYYNTGNGTIKSRVTFTDGRVTLFDSILLNPIKFAQKYNNDEALSVIRSEMRIFNNLNNDPDTGIPGDTDYQNFKPDDYVNMGSMLKACLGDAAKLTFFENNGESQVDFDTAIDAGKATTKYVYDGCLLQCMYDSLIFSDLIIKIKAPEYAISDSSFGYEFNSDNYEGYKGEV